MPDSHLPEPTLLIVAAILVVIAGLLAMTEASLSTVSRARSAEIAREGVRGARALEAIAGDIVRHLNLLLLLRMLCEFGATTLVALVTIDEFGAGWRAALITAGSMTVIMFVAVGVAPRTIGRQHAYTVGRIAAPLVRWLGRVLNPLASLLILVGNAFTPGKGFRDGPFATQVELRELVDLAEQRGVVEHGERDMIHSALALGDTIAREVMVPRTDMVFLDDDATIRQGLKLAMRSGFSRVPLVGDTIDDVLGIVYLKDIIKATEAGRPDDDPGSRPDARAGRSCPSRSRSTTCCARCSCTAYTWRSSWTNTAAPPAWSPSRTSSRRSSARSPTNTTRTRSRRSRSSKTGRCGSPRACPSKISGEIFDITIDGDEVETVGGLLAQALGRVPIPGAEATVDGLRLRAEGTTGRRNRIDTVLVWREDDENPPPRSRRVVTPGEATRRCLRQLVRSANAQRRPPGNCPRRTRSWSPSRGRRALAPVRLRAQQYATGTAEPTRVRT